ncbi:hypothetical protein WJ973_12305 [Achromobacter xylosoxidans]
MNSGRYNKMERIGHERFRRLLVSSRPAAVGGVVCVGCCIRSVVGHIKPANGQVEDTGHVWDGDLTELNNWCLAGGP